MNNHRNMLFGLSQMNCVSRQHTCVEYVWPLHTLHHDVTSPWWSISKRFVRLENPLNFSTLLITKTASVPKCPTRGTLKAIYRPLLRKEANAQDLSHPCGRWKLILLWAKESEIVLTKAPFSHVFITQTLLLHFTCSCPVPDCPMQYVHGEENHIDLIHFTGPVRYLVIGSLSLSLILWAVLQQLLASIKSSSTSDRTHLLVGY